MAAIVLSLPTQTSPMEIAQTDIGRKIKWWNFCKRSEIFS